MSAMYCCICFTPITTGSAWRDRDGRKWDVCSRECAEEADLRAVPGAEETPMSDDSDFVSVPRAALEGLLFAHYGEAWSSLNATDLMYSQYDPAPLVAALLAVPGAEETE